MINDRTEAFRAIAVRSFSEYPSVSERKIGTFPMGLETANSEMKTWMMNENMRTSLWLAVIELCFVLRCFLCMVFTPGSAFYNLSRTIRKQKKTVLVRTVFLFAISISLFRISTADKAFSIFLACVNFLFHSESMRRETWYLSAPLKFYHNGYFFSIIMIIEKKYPLW